MEEMEGFFGVVINMGLIQLPELEAYWSTNLTGNIPFFGSVFSRSCFEQIFWMLHVSKDDPDPPGKKINKVKDILDILIPNFQQSFAPGRNVSVDEMMVGFRGGFAAKQYMPTKPTKYGIKIIGNDETMAFRYNRLLALGWGAAQKKKPLIWLALRALLSLSQYAHDQLHVQHSSPRLWTNTIFL